MRTPKNASLALSDLGLIPGVTQHIGRPSEEELGAYFFGVFLGDLQGHTVIFTRRVADSSSKRLA